MYLYMSGTHSFPTFIHHKECQHGPLPTTDRKPYIAKGQNWWSKFLNIMLNQKIFEGSLALKKITEAVLGAHNQNFNNLEHYSGIS